MNHAMTQAMKQLGWQGMAGVALLLVAALFQNFSLQPLEQETSHLRERINAAKGRTSGDKNFRPAGDRQQELEAFYDALPEERDVTDILAKIHVTGEAAGVELKQAEYHLENKGTSHVEYVMNLPIRGNYSQIRALLARVLADNPAMALDQFTLQRDKIGDGILNANVRLVLFLRSAR